MFLLATNCMEAVILLFGLIGQLLGIISNAHESLLTPLQLLYINIVTDSVPAFAFAFMPITRLPHESSKKHSLHDFFSRHTLVKIASTTLLGSFISLAAYFYMNSMNPDQAQAYLFSTLVAVQIWVFVDEWVSQGKHKVTPFFVAITVGMLAFHMISMVYLGVTTGNQSLSQATALATSSLLLSSLVFLIKSTYRLIRSIWQTM